MHRNTFTGDILEHKFVQINFTDSTPTMPGRDPQTIIGTCQIKQTGSTIDDSATDCSKSSISEVSARLLAYIQVTQCKANMTWVSSVILV